MHVGTNSESLNYLILRRSIGVAWDYRYIIAELLGPSVPIFGNCRVSINNVGQEVDKNMNRLSSTPQRVFGSVDPVALAFDDARSYARKFIQLGGPASETLWELETALRGTTKQLSSKIATGLVNTIAQSVGLPSPESIANLIDQTFTATATFERSCIKILTFGDDLRVLKEKEELHMLLGALLDAWDMLFQMQCDTWTMKNAPFVFKILDKMISKMGDVKDFGSKVVRDSTRVVSSSKSYFHRLIHGKQTDGITDAEILKSEETIATTAPRLRELLTSINEQWPDLLKALEELQPHLEDMSEKLDVALEVKSSEAEA
jgi:hypothetical protein